MIDTEPALEIQATPLDMLGDTSLTLLDKTVKTFRNTTSSSYYIVEKPQFHIINVLTRGTVKVFFIPMPWVAYTIRCQSFGGHSTAAVINAGWSNTENVKHTPRVYIPPLPHFRQNSVCTANNFRVTSETADMDVVNGAIQVWKAESFQSYYVSSGSMWAPTKNLFNKFLGTFFEKSVKVRTEHQWTADEFLSLLDLWEKIDVEQILEFNPTESFYDFMVR